MSSKPSAYSVRPEVDFLGQVRRHQRRNVLVFLAEGLTSSFCWGFIESPVFAAYLLSLGWSGLMVQTATSAYLFAWYVPMVLFVPLIERRKGRVGPLIRYCVPNRLVLVVLALSAWGAGAWGAGAGLAGVWVAIGVLVLTGGGVHVCWQDLNSRVVLPSVRGLYVGSRLVIVTVGVVSTGLVTYAFVGSATLGEAHAAPPAAFAWPFTVGAIVFLAALPMLLLFREPIPDGDPPPW